MLILPLKACTRYELSIALAEWLDNPEKQVHFEPSNPLQFVLPKPTFSSLACRDDLLRLQALRNSMSDVFLKAASHKHAWEENALEDAQEYHACLLQFERRGFPTLESSRHFDSDSMETNIYLSWKGAWPPHTVEVHSSLIWDRACVSFNIAALLTHAASECSVTDRDACKQAVGYCQQAAAVLTVLKELVPQQDYVTVDFCESHLNFWIKYLTAAAQEYIYRMVALGDVHQTKHAMLAKLAKSAYKLYNEALLEAQGPRLQSELTAQATEWGSYCKAASMLSAAKASYHSAVGHRIAAEWGQEIARLREAVKMLESCRDFLMTLPSDGVTSYIRRECLTVTPVVEDRFQEADRDNFRVYHQEIPKELPDIEEAQMAKVGQSLPDAMLQTKKEMFIGL